MFVGRCNRHFKRSRMKIVNNKVISQFFHQETWCNYTVTVCLLITHKTKSCRIVVNRIVTMTTLWLSSKKLSKITTCRPPFYIFYDCLSRKPLHIIQNEKLSNSCQSNCHYDNFMVVIQKVVKNHNVSSTILHLLWLPFQKTIAYN